MSGRHEQELRAQRGADEVSIAAILSQTFAPPRNRRETSEPSRAEEDASEQILPVEFVPRQAERPASPSSSSDWYLHETRTIREPVYRTERGDRDADPVGLSDANQFEQLPLIVYGYDNGIELWSRMGELNTRDMLVMSYLSSVFWDQGCPADNRVRGDAITLRSIARALGMNPQASTGLIRASIQRLSTARVQVAGKKRVVDPDRIEGAAGEPDPGLEVDEIRGTGTTGFLGNQWWREHCQKGRVVKRDNWIEIDSVMADMIRSQNFTWLKASVLQRLRNNPMAVKLYAWARTHRPDDKGQLFGYTASKLATRLGCSDTNSTRRRNKVVAAMDALVKAAPNEFPGYDQRVGKTDLVLTLRRRLVGHEERRARLLEHATRPIEPRRDLPSPADIR